MADLYPLRFDPVFVQRVWGGRNLAPLFPAIPEGPIGEAWVLSGHAQGPTPVQNGPLAGTTLAELQVRFGADLLGTRGLAASDKGFPLLFKLLDCQDDLSVQVHPADNYAGLPAGERGKTEMWVILQAEPGAEVVYGLKAGMSADRFAAAVAEGRTMDTLRSLPVRAGDVLFVPAGTVHALGRGLVVAEIQQSSDTTYRLYDYDRIGLDGQPRPLHVAHALNVTRYGEPPVPARLPECLPGEWQELVRCPYFAVAFGACSDTWALTTTPASFQALLVTRGAGAVHWANGSVPLEVGTSVLIPASLGSCTLAGDFQALFVTIP